MDRVSNVQVFVHSLPMRSTLQFSSRVGATLNGSAQLAQMNALIKWPFYQTLEIRFFLSRAHQDHNLPHLVIPFSQRLDFNLSILRHALLNLLFVWWKSQAASFIEENRCSLFHRASSGGWHLARYVLSCFSERLQSLCYNHIRRSQLLDSRWCGSLFRSPDFLFDHFAFDSTSLNFCACCSMRLKLSNFGASKAYALSLLTSL